MPINVNEITSAEWSLSTRGQGEVEQGFDDINQCIKLIVSTQRGTDPMRPDFGCDLWQFIDYPINSAAPKMVNEILSALARWETRIQVSNVSYSILEESVTFNVFWILQDNKQKGSAAITLEFAPSPILSAPAVPVTPIPSPILAVSLDCVASLSWLFLSPIGVSFQILRSTNGGAFVQIDTVNSVLTYTDSTIIGATNYTYKIRAVKGSRVSAFSNEISIETANLEITSISKIAGVYAASLTAQGVDRFSINVYDNANNYLLGRAENIAPGTDMSVSGNWLGFTSGAGLTASDLADYTVLGSTVEADGASLYSFDLRAFTANSLGALAYTDNIAITFEVCDLAPSLEMDESLLSMNANYSTSSPAETLALPISGGIYEIQIDWGDGTTSRGTAGIDSHTYADAGNYDVRILGAVNQFMFNNAGDKLKLNYINQWGELELSSLSSMLYGCSNLSSIPTGAITGVEAITDISRMFNNCTSLSVFPPELLADMPVLEILTDTFRGTGIVIIPDGFFDNNTLITGLSGAFRSCTSLNTVADGLLDNLSLLVGMPNAFRSCTSLTAVPNGFFDNNTALVNLLGVFYLSSLSSINAGMFDNNTLVTNFSLSFSNTDIASIPSNLFINCTQVTTFANCFANCSSLLGSSGSLWLLSGIAGYNLTSPLYDESTPNGSSCFNNSSGLTDFASIPAYWK